MKPSTLLLIASLVANIALLAYVASQRNPAAAAPAPATVAPPTRGTTGASDDAALRAALASGDEGALVAAGVSADFARELAIGRVFARLAERLRAARASAPSDDRWWRNRTTNSAAREQQLLVRRELNDALVTAFGEDLGLLGGDSSQFSFLPPAKRDALRRIVQDYDEMIATFSAGGVQLASDKERLRLLRAERDRDIAALLSPEERAAYELRTSPSAAAVRARYGDAIQSEAEFQTLFALQKAFDEKHPREALTGRISPEVIRARSEAERQLEAQMRAAVGDDRYAALRRAADPDVRTIDSLVSRLNLPPSTTDAVLSAREKFAAESQRIQTDTTSAGPERRAQIQELAAQAKAELTRTLGGEAADAYAERSPWLGLLQSGTAYSTTPRPGMPGPVLGGAQSVYPVFPSGAAPANAERVIVSAAPAFEAGVTGDPAGAAPTRVQVMSFSSSGGAGETDAPATQVRRQPASPTPGGASPAPSPRP